MFNQAIEVIPVPAVHSGKCDAQDARWGSVRDCTNDADWIFINDSNGGFAVMCDRHESAFIRDVIGYGFQQRIGQFVDYNEPNILAAIERWNKFGETKPTEPFVAVVIPHTPPKAVIRVENNLDFKIIRDGKTYDFAEKMTSAKCDITGGESYSVKKSLGFVSRGDCIWQYELAGRHEGEAIKIAVCNVQQDADEYGWGTKHEGVFWADDLSPLDGDIWETYADEMDDILKADLSDALAT